MPSPTEILDGLTYVANNWTGVAVAWHVAMTSVLAAFISGWRPTQRTVGLMLALPLASVSLFAWLAQNPFNGALFAVGAVALVAIGIRLPHIAVPMTSKSVTMLGIAMVAFGWVYPHFLEGGSAARYLYAAPTGLIPCPTLSVAAGLALLVGGFGSRGLPLVLAAMGLFYGLFGVLRLGVYLDAGLIVGAMALGALVLQSNVRHVSQTDSSAARSA